MSSNSNSQPAKDRLKRPRWLARIGLGARRLRINLLIAFLLLALIPVAILTFVSATTEEARERDRSLGLLEAHANAAAQEIEDWATANSTELESQLSDPATRNDIILPLLEGDVATLEFGVARQAFAERAAELVGPAVGPIRFEYIVLVDSAAFVRGTSDEQRLRRNVGTEVWFRQALEQPGQMLLVGPLPETFGSGQTREGVYFAMGVTNDAGQVVGVLARRLDLETLGDVMTDALPAGVFGRSGRFFLVSKGSQYVAASFTPDTELATDEVVPLVLRGTSGEGAWEADGSTRVIGAYRWIEPLQMGFILRQNESDALGDIRSRYWTDIIVGAVVAVLALGAGFFVSQRVTRPLVALSETADRLSQGDFEAQAPDTGFAEYQQVANSLNAMTQHLKTQLAQQEDTIRERTRQLQITAQLGRAISAETNPERLLQTTIGAIRDQLGYYHAQVFLLDDLRQFAVLRASTGEAGQILLSRGHRLPVGSKSVIGQCTSSGETILASDTARAEYWMPNPLLPETRAELAVPIRIGDQIIGALDVQSGHSGAFDEETIAALQTIADQLAVALRNAQLFEEKEGLISASVQLTQMLTRDSWDTYLTDRPSVDAAGFTYDLMDIRRTGDKPSGEDGGNGHGLNMPIALRGEVIGELEAELPPGQAFSEEEKTLVGQVLDRVALALENARLFEQTQASLQESTRLYQASRQIAAADTVEELAKEVAGLAALEIVDRVILMLLDDPDAPPDQRYATLGQRWVRDPNDRVLDSFPERLHTSRPPLAMIEQVDAKGLVIRDMDDTRMDEGPTKLHQQMGVKTLGIFPLITGRRTVGWLIIHGTRQAGVLNDSAVRYYRTLADQAATALEGLRLLEQAQVRARRLQATNEVSRAASSILNPEILLPLVVDRVQDAFDYYHVQIFLVDEKGESAVLRASTGDVGQKLLARAHKLPIGSQSVIGQCTLLGEPVIVRDTETDPVHQPNELLPRTRSEMAIPLKTGDRVIGALDVQSHERNAFDAEAQAILQSLTGEIAVTMENAQLFQEIQARVSELSTINIVSQAVSRATTLDEVYDVVATQLTRTFGARNAFLAVYDEAAQMIHLPLLIEQGELVHVPSTPLGTGLTSHVIKTKQVMMLNENVEEESRKLGAVTIGHTSKSILMVPLLLGEEVVGVISIQDEEQENAYNEAHVRQMTTLAAYIAVKIRNAELLDEAQRRAGELGFLFNVTRAAVATSDLDASLGSVAEILVNEIGGAESAIIYLASVDGEHLEPRAAVGWSRDIAARGPIEWGQGMVGYGATLAQPMIIQDAQADPRFQAVDPRVRGAMLVPLMTANALIGVLAVESSKPEAFQDGHLRLLEAASSTLTAIIQNARLLDEITRANEQLQELDRMKSQFLANMSHELRTPLNSIIGFSRVMLKGIDGPLNDLQTQDLNTIYNSGQHLLGLINNILDLSKLEARMMEIQPEYTGLVEIVDTVMSAAKGLTKEKSIELFKEVEPNLPQVWGDPQRIRQVLLNLVSNAVKFTKEGSITVRAFRREANPAEGTPAAVQIDVTDTGIGIPEDKIHLVFEAFQQVDGSTTRQYEGTGLGLPISKQFVELHGGRMWATSNVDQGSTFSFFIPLHPPMTEGEEQLSRPEGDTRPVVLAVDDEPGVIDLYTRYLEKDGYAVMGLSHANDLVRQVTELQPVAVILDLNLPGKDGWLAISDLKHNNETQHVPVIVCSIDEERERATSAGVAAYLVKPIVEDDLLSAVRAAIEASPRLLHNVVVVDANPEYGQYIKTLLESTGYFSVRATTMGFEGLQALGEIQPSVVVMDVDLNDMDGYGLIGAMRSHPDTSHIPVLVVTAREMTAEDLAKIGTDANTAYVSKYTFDPEQFLTSLYGLMERASRPA